MIAGRRARRLSWLTACAGFLALLALVAPVASAALPDGAPPGITVTPPTSNLHDGQLLRIAGRGFDPHAAVVVVQCSVRAASDGPDFCNERQVAVAPADAGGGFVAHFRVRPVIETAGGAIDCRATTCVLGAENLGNRSQLAFVGLGFAAGASHRGLVSPVARGSAKRIRVLAGLAPPLARGRVGGVLPRVHCRQPRHRRRGEGLLRLTMSAPGTSWASPRATAVVAQARVDRGPWQTFVLFAGSRRFTYEGFTGSLATGRHAVSVRVRPDLSATQGRRPRVVVSRAELLVVTPSNPGYEALAHSPVLYDRSASVHSDTPLITYAQTTRAPAGGRQIAYTVTWSNEDAGTGFVPFLLWGGYGRMTDVETLIDEHLDRHGRLLSATYLGCKACGRDFPENRTALDETHLPFHGARFGGHPVLRVATGNNDASDQGTTPLRFQPALAAPPARGETREGAMDRNPWTYGIMDAEIRREREDRSTSSLNTGPGDARQELIVELDTVVRDAASVEVGLRLAGDPRTYRNDFGTTQPLYTGGLGRTVVKVPLGRSSRALRDLTLTVRPSGAARPSLAVRRVRVLRYDGRRIVGRHVPRVRVVVASLAAPPASAARVRSAFAPALGR